MVSEQTYNTDADMMSEQTGRTAADHRENLQIKAGICGKRSERNGKENIGGGIFRQRCDEESR